MDPLLTLGRRCAILGSSMPLVSSSGLGKHYGTRVLFEDVAFSLEDRERVGLIGPNGAGKTTIFRILLGEETEHDGTIVRRKGLRIAALEQDPKFPVGATVREAVLSGDPELCDLERRMREIHEELERGGAADRLLPRLAELETRFEHLGGWTLEHRADRILEGVGFPQARHEERVEALSGGEQNRVAFARVLLTEPDLWLLDEPTNHLDLDGILFLEETLRESRAGAIVVSHDRRFLDRMTEKTWSLEEDRLWIYPGSYSRAKALREERLLSSQREYQKQRVEIEKEEAFIRRYQAGQRARQAKGRSRRLERLERLERPSDRRRVMALNLPSGGRSGRRVLAVRELAAGFETRTLFRDLTLEVESGETLGIVGPNGAGKTTFLRILLGDLAPLAGDAAWGQGVKPGTLSQHEAFPSDEITPLGYLREREKKRTDQELRDVLAAMLFRSHDVDKPVSVLSGGERKRLMLTRLLLEGNNVLLLDEPTNHLDLPSREALELALSAYDGTLIVISHDRYFLDEVADRILWIENGEWRLTAGGFEEALAARRRPVAVPRPPPKPEPSKPPPPKKSPLARIKTEELEARILAGEGRLRELEARFADPEVYRNADSMRETRAAIDGLKRELAALEAEYASR